MLKEKTYQFKGRIIDSITHEGIEERLKIEVRGKDEKQQYVKSITTDEKGSFEIELEEWRLREAFWPRPSPELFFKVFRGDELIRSTEDSLTWDIRGGDQVVDIEVQVPGLVESEMTSKKEMAGGIYAANIIEEPPDYELTIVIESPKNNAIINFFENRKPTIKVSGKIVAKNVSIDSVKVRIDDGESQNANHSRMNFNYNYESGIKFGKNIRIQADITGHYFDTRLGKKVTVTESNDILVTINDSAPPDLIIKFPQNNTKIYDGNGTVTIVSVDVEASDYFGLAWIWWYLDDSNLKTTPLNGWRDWNGKELIKIPPSSNENHRIKVVCTDMSKNSRECYVDLIVDVIIPYLNITEPTSGFQVDDYGKGANVELKGTAIDKDSKVFSVEYTIDGSGTIKAIPCNVNDWSNWSATLVIKGSRKLAKQGYEWHKIQVICKDKAGNRSKQDLDLEVVVGYKPRGAGDLISPRAYLENLIQFARNYIDVPGTITDDVLQNTFFQPFSDLKNPINEEWGNQQVNQVRICVEVLNRYLNSRGRSLSYEVKSRYYREAYYAMLKRIGTSYEEIRLIRGADKSTRKILADRLGFGHANLWDEYLNKISLQPEYINEVNLKKLFGLEATEGSSQEPQLLSWQLENLRMLWEQQDYRGEPGASPIVDPDLIGEDELKNDLINHMHNWDGVAYVEKYKLLKYLKIRFAMEWLDPAYAIIRNIDSYTIKIKGTFEWPPFSIDYPQNYILLHLKIVKTRKTQIFSDEIYDKFTIRKVEKYLFSWEKIPGNDNERLIEFLNQNFNVHLDEWTEFEKFDNGNIISPRYNSNISLRLNETKTKVNLEIHGRIAYGIETYEFIVKTENGELNIYETVENNIFIEIENDLDLWKTRNELVEGWYRELKRMRENKTNAIEGLSAIIDATIRPPSTTLCQDVQHKPLNFLQCMEKQLEMGHDIKPVLKGMHLTMKTFSYLNRIRALAEKRTVMDSEWEDVYNILVQIKKSQVYDSWRMEEHEKYITLTQDYFKISNSSKKLTPWRATEQARDNWKKTLQSRIDQEAAVIEAFQANIRAVEEATLPALRDAIIEATESSADWLTEQLLIDAKNSGSQQTTRIMQAIETLQGVSFSVRIGHFTDHIAASSWSILKGKENDFDEDWKWMCSYHLWCSATLVFIYPQNILFPRLREDKSKEYKEKVEDEVYKEKALTPSKAREIASNFYNAATEVKDLFSRKFGKFKLYEDNLTNYDLRKLKGIHWDYLRNNPPSSCDPCKKNCNEFTRHLKEIFYFVPMQLALQLHKSGEYVAALDWFQRIYAYNLPLNKGESINSRKIYYCLKQEQNNPPNLARPPDWLRQNPHELALFHNSNPYTRFTLMSIVRCLLDFADSEFTRDTGESIAKARSLYMTARSLLLLPDMQPPTSTSDADIILSNPVQDALLWRVENQLSKLRQGRNIAGMKRQVGIYMPSKTVNGLSPISNGTQLEDLRPTPYRYSVLIERSKQLVSISQQIEAAYFAALEKFDEKSYSLKKAGYDIELAGAGKDLQKLRVIEAELGIELAEKQKGRAVIQQTTYQSWIDTGFIDYEKNMLQNYKDIKSARNWLAASEATLTAAQSITTAAGGGILGTGFGPALIGAGAVTIAAAGRAFITGMVNDAERRLQVNTLNASHERRKQEWGLQKSLAAQDILIGEQQVLLAQDHVAVAAQEEAISDIQLTQAKAMAEYLASQFMNAELYEWMSGVLGGVYSYFLQQATALAKLAQSQLAFERQEAPPMFIHADYWATPTDTGSTGSVDGKTPDRRGITGSARLLQDIYQLDQFAFETNKRKLNLMQTFSLSRLAPFEFQQFRETGVLPFATPMKLLDQCFPGHYLRLIKKVRTSVIALIPPTQGIRATLIASGISRVVVGGDMFQTVVVRRDPELVALTSPSNATGVFELDSQSEMLMPFESMGMDTTWEFQMPRASNQFDFRTIADVLITIEYTALNNFEYRQQVIQTLDREISSDRSFSIRNQFPDEWYKLHNSEEEKEQKPEQMVINLKTEREDFPPNIEDLKIDQVLLYFSRKDGLSFEVPVTHIIFTEMDRIEYTGGGATTIDGVISTRRGNGNNWIPILGKKPMGNWELELPNTEEMKKHFEDEEINDILFIITYSGRTPEWPI